MNSQKEAHRQQRIETIMKRLMGNLYDRKMPVVPKTVGPHNPDAFNSFFDRRNAINDALSQKLNEYSLDEIDLRFDMTGGEKTSALNQDDPNLYFQQEIYALKNKHPYWYAAGFGHPNFKADFGYWSGMPHYSRNEALCLSLGVEPKYITDKDIQAYRDASQNRMMSPQIGYLLRRADLIDRTFSGAIYRDNIKPEEILGWVEAKNIEVHEEFPSMLRVAATPNVHDRLNRGKQGKLKVEGPLDHREKIKMAKIITAIAITEYGYKPNAKKSPIPKEIEDITAKLGIVVTDDTVRRYLKLGAEYLPEDWKTE